MGGFVITDQERNPVQVLVLHPSHLQDDYIKDLLLNISKFDEDMKARLKILLTDTLEAFVAADSMGNKPKEHSGLIGADEVMDGLITILTTVIFKRISESELLQVILSHEEMIGLLARAMATEGVKIIFPILIEKCKDELSEGLTWERLEDRLRYRLENRLRGRLPERFRGIKKTLETDIQGRCKQDSLAKTFALAQTTWFVVQCIARKAQHLPLTEIELMACAYATLNAAIYFFWWYKPFRIDYPILLRSQIPPEVREVDTSTTNVLDIFGQLLGMIYIPAMTSVGGFKCQLSIRVAYIMTDITKISRILLQKS